MTFRRQLYSNGNYSGNRFGATAEIDLRQEFDDLVLGGNTSIQHGHKLILRKMRRDESNSLVACVCKDSLTREPDPENQCPYCLGEGYYWDESWMTGYSTYVGADGGLSAKVRQLFPGTINVDYMIFYLRYDTDITYDDKIVELKLDTEGVPIVPYKREAIFKPQTIDKRRSDRGRIEYIRIFCREQDAIRLKN